jgi:hypothetical protein
MNSLLRHYSRAGDMEGNLRQGDYGEDVFCDGRGRALRSDTAQVYSVRSVGEDVGRKS